MTNYILSSDDYKPVTGQTVVVADGVKGTVKCVAQSGGNVSGPGSSTDNALVRWDGTTGTAIQNSNASLTDAGALTVATSLTATLGAITATNGNFVFGTAGNKVTRPAATTTTAGANSFGSVTLVAGTATVATTAVTANSLIKLWRQSIGSTGALALGGLTIGTITAGTSFIINSVQLATANIVQASDVSVVGWEIVN